MPTEPIPNPKPRTSSGVAGMGGIGGVGSPKPPSEITAPIPVPMGVPRQVGPYEVQRLLGTGGMASVYAALQKQPRRTVALKVMKAGIAQSRGEAALRRFKREIEILGKLHHPFIAAVYDAGTFDDGSGPAPYFVMEYIPGAMNILEYIAKKDMNLRDRLKLFVKVCAAVEHGHSHKVIHRDLKPGNILIDQYGEPKIIDFGIAHAAELDVSQQTMQTETGNLVGTLQYMAPEQVDTRPQDLDGRCDVYALGVLLYKMTTGKPPYDLEALPVFEAIRIIREESPKRPSEINSDVKGDLETVILKAMERDRARRYRNAGSLGRDIVRFLANKPINARRASLGYRASLFVKRNAAVLGVIAVIVFIAAAAVGYTTWERQRIKRQQAKKDQEIRAREEQLAQQATTPAATQSAGTPTPSTKVEPFTLSNHTASVTQLRFVPSAGAQPLLASASSDHQVMLWDIGLRQVTQRADPLGATIAHMAVSADGSTIAAAGAGDDDPIAIVRCVDGQVVRTLRDLGGAVTALAIGPSGEVVAWGSSNLTLNLRATEARGQLPRDNPRREPRSMRSGSGAFTSIVTSRNENIIAAGTQGGVVIAWEPRAGAAAGSTAPPGPRRLNGLRKPIVAMTFVEDAAGSMRLIAIADDGSAYHWRAAPDGWNGEAWLAAAKPVVAAAFSSDGAYLAVATADGTQAWSMGDSADGMPQRVGTIMKSDDTPTAVAIDDSGQWIALGMLNGDVKMMPVSK